MPLGTVIVPVKNVGSWIAEAVKSIDGSDEIDLEILCIDDQSTDDTVDVIRSLHDPRVRVIPNMGSGIVDGRNTGVAIAQGEEIFCLDGDDRYVPGAIARLHTEISLHAEAAAVAGYSSFIDEAGRQIVDSPPDWPEGPINEILLAGRFIHLSAFVFRKKDLLSVGLARPFFKMSEDRDFLFRLAEQRHVLYSPVAVTELRIRSSSLSRTTKESVKRWYDERAIEFRDQRAETGADDLMRDKAPELPTNLPELPQENSNAFENRLIVNAAWKELSRNNVRSSRKLVLRTIFSWKYIYYLPREKMKLLALVFLFGIRSR